MSPEQTKVVIKWISDGYDCETCGSNWASGALVTITTPSKTEVIDMTPVAACFDGVSYEDSQVWDAVLHKLGVIVEHEREDVSYYGEDDED